MPSKTTVKLNKPLCQRAAKVAPVPVSWLPRLMRLPTPLFKIVARRMLRIDPRAVAETD